MEHPCPRCGTMTEKVCYCGGLREVPTQAAALQPGEVRLLLEQSEHGECDMTDDLDFFSTIETPKKKRRKSKFLKTRQEKAEDRGFTQKEINIVKANLAMPDATMVEKGKAAGLVGKDTAISNCVSSTLKRVKEKISNNQRLQELLQLKNAGVDKIATVVAEAMNAEQPFRGRETVQEGAKLVTRDVIKMLPDHRARMDAAKFAAEAQQAMPDKKVVIEEFKYEQKVAIIAEIKANPQEAMQQIQQLLEGKRRTENG